MTTFRKSRGDWLNCTCICFQTVKSCLSAEYWDPNYKSPFQLCVLLLWKWSNDYSVTPASQNIQKWDKHWNVLSLSICIMYYSFCCILCFFFLSFSSKTTSKPEKRLVIFSHCPFHFCVNDAHTFFCWNHKQTELYSAKYVITNI